MPTRSSYAPGTPSWIDIGSPDIPGTKAFYGGLFGWEFADLGEEAGGYTMASIGGDIVCGIGPAQNPGPPFWTTYVNVVNAEETEAKIAAAGGTVIVPVMDVMEAGRMGVYVDPNGAAFSTWQNGETIGAGRVNEHGAFCWSELNTRNLNKAKAFYSEIFGWAWNDNPEYGEFSVGDRVVGGAMPMTPDRFPPEVPEHWLVYFAVDDIQASFAKVGDLGGQTMMEPFPAGDAGLITVVSDPQGAILALIQLNQPGE